MSLPPYLAALGLVGFFGALPLLAASSEPTAPAGMTIDAQFPGGNIVVDRIEGDQVELRPDLRDTQGWWFYWNFRVRGAAGRTLTFHFTGPNPIGVRGPAVSTDGGLAWAWLVLAASRASRSPIRSPRVMEDVRFCFAIPYQEEHWRRFLASYRHNQRLSVEELCRTGKGRSVERVHVKGPQAEPTLRILLTARHHACESLAELRARRVPRGRVRRHGGRPLVSGTRRTSWRSLSSTRAALRMAIKARTASPTIIIGTTRAKASILRWPQSVRSRRLGPAAG